MGSGYFSGSDGADYGKNGGKTYDNSNGDGNDDAARKQARALACR
jgi:hypothetical protein